MRFRLFPIFLACLLAAPCALAKGPIPPQQDLQTKLLVTLDNLQVVAKRAGLPPAILDAIRHNRKALQMTSPEVFDSVPESFREQVSSALSASVELKVAFAPQQPPMVLKSSGLPAANYPTVNWDFTIQAIGDAISGDSQDQTRGDVCGYPGYTANTRFSILNLAIAAEATKDIAEQFCNEDILGENVSVVCVFTDILAYVAIGINENQDLCNDFMTASEVTGSYNRLGHIHGDLETVDSNLASARAALLSAIATHDSDLKSALSTHDSDIKSRLSTHDADVKGALSTHDTDIKNLLANLQGGVDSANLKLQSVQAVQRQIIKLLLTPQGRRMVDPEVLTCTGADCPNVLDCPGDECDFPIH